MGNRGQQRATRFVVPTLRTPSNHTACFAIPAQVGEGRRIRRSCRARGQHGVSDRVRRDASGGHKGTLPLCTPHQEVPLDPAGALLMFSLRSNTVLAGRTLLPPNPSCHGNPAAVTLQWERRHCHTFHPGHKMC